MLLDIRQLAARRILAHVVEFAHVGRPLHQHTLHALLHLLVAAAEQRQGAVRRVSCQCVFQGRVQP